MQPSAVAGSGPLGAPRWHNWELPVDGQNGLGLPRPRHNFDMAADHTSMEYNYLNCVRVLVLRCSPAIIACRKGGTDHLAGNFILRCGQKQVPDPVFLARASRLYVFAKLFR